VPANDERIGYTVLDHDVAEIDTESLTVTAHFSGAGTNLFDLAVHPVTGDLWVTNTEALNLTRFEPALRGHFEDNRVTKVALPGGVPSAFDLNAGVNYSTLPNPSAQATALAQPTALSMAADGSHLWVAAFASDRVAKVLTSGTVAARVDLRPAGGSRVMRGPRGLAWQQNHQRLYVMNKLANSVSVIDTAAGTLIAEVPAGTHDPTPSIVKEGRGFLFDARLSGNGTMSCASCHIDADRDGLAWDLGDPGGEMITVQGKDTASGETTFVDRVMHPMKGPMVTQTLRGLHDGTGLMAPFHWRGDRPTLQSFNPTFEKLMGGSQLSTADINAMADYLNTLRHHPNPNEQLDRTPPLLFGNGNTTVGRTLFNQSNTHCATCHALPNTTGNNIDQMSLVSSTQPVKDPSIVLAYQKLFFFPQFGSESLSGFGMLHDGTGSSLPTVHPYTAPGLANVQQFADVKAFILTLDTGTAPAVGYDLTVTTDNRTAAAVLNDLSTMEGQVAQSHCDLIVRGVLQGRTRAFRYYCDNAVCSYLSDRFSEPGITGATLLEMLTPGDSLTWLGVPRGQGIHFGGDRDGDSVLDADEAVPVPAVTTSGPAFLLQWPNAHSDWHFESSGSLQGPWSPLTLPRAMAGSLFSIQGTAVPGQKAFYRLRRTW
jgi:YVTN family beta-propeller protein